jgi:hypothetical protein
MKLLFFPFCFCFCTVITLPCDECPVVDVDVLMLDTSAICRNVVACANANSIIQLKATEITEK